MMNCCFPPDKLQNCKKLKKNNSGAEISFSKSSIRKSIKQGGSLWTSLLKLTPFLTKGVSKVAPHLATGAVSALGSLGIDKIFGKGMQGGAILPNAIVKMLQKGIEVPVKFLVNLINMKEMFTNAQKTLIGKGLQSGKGIVLKPTKRQIHGGCWELWQPLEFPWQLNLLQKYLGKDCMFPQKLQLVSKFHRSLFYGNLPPSMAHGAKPRHGRDKAGAGEKKEKDFCWEKTAHSTKSPSWEQFFRRSPPGR